MFVASLSGALRCFGALEELVAAGPPVGTPLAGERGFVGFVSLCCLVVWVRLSTRRLPGGWVPSFGCSLASGVVAALLGGLVSPMSQSRTDDSRGVDEGRLLWRLLPRLAVMPSRGSLP